MNSDFYTIAIEQIPLLLGWSGYALIHSMTASLSWKNWAKRHWPSFFARYRLAYNGLALLLLLPIVWLATTSPGPILWRWTGVFFWLANGFAVVVLLGFLWRGGGYDLIAFLGLRPEHPTGSSPQLVISGWHRFVRHPWYSLALALIWTRDMNAASFFSASSITLYFIIGSRLEEHKLIAIFGDRYREYRRKVPGLFPLPWRVLSLEDVRRLTRPSD